MPVWHEELGPLVASGKIVLLGVIQEQHAERCRLFAQWQGFDWPILHDPINWMGSTGVPIVRAIDEHGVLRAVGPQPAWVRETFLSTDYPSNDAADETPPTRPDVEQLRAAASDEDVASWRRLGDAAVVWGGDAKLDLAVQAYTYALQRADDGMTHFRLGVALRKRFESERRQDGDFQQAVEHWTQALTLDPNQYIWRRRIQQYGPRLIKPYPFYDWIGQARQEIRDRGETPLALEVEPSGAEFAQPAREFETLTTDDVSPDPEGRIVRDEDEEIRVTTAAAPARIQPGESVRIHFEFRPTAQVDWNNEAEPLRLWLQAPPGWQLERSALEFTAVPPSVESRETRRLEVELHAPADAQPGPATLRGYALYYMCRNSDGVCLLRRQDLDVSLSVSAP